MYLRYALVSKIKRFKIYLSVKTITINGSTVIIMNVFSTGIGLKNVGGPKT